MLQQVHRYIKLFLHHEHVITVSSLLPLHRRTKLKSCCIEIRKLQIHLLITSIRKAAQLYEILLLGICGFIIHTKVLPTWLPMTWRRKRKGINGHIIDLLSADYFSFIAIVFKLPGVLCFFKIGYWIASYFFPIYYRWRVWLCQINIQQNDQWGYIYNEIFYYRLRNLRHYILGRDERKWLTISCHVFHNSCYTSHNIVHNHELQTNIPVN